MNNLPPRITSPQIKSRAWKITLHLFPLLYLLLLSTYTSAQNTYLLNGINNDIGDAHVQALENGVYWVIQALPSGEPATGYPIIRITEFDECGPTRASDYSHPNIWGVKNFNQSFIDGDTVRVSMRLNPRDLYNHDEIGVLSVNKNNFGHRYQYVRADNVIIPEAFIPVGTDQYLLYSFLSYTDRPPQYCSFLLDKEFNIQKYYENFSEYTSTGSVAKLEDGYILATSENIYKLDKELNPVWRKELSDRHYLGSFIKQADGVVMYVVQPPFPREIVLIKIDFNGNIIWQSGDFNFNAMQYRFYTLTEKSDKNLELVVFKYDPDDLWTDQLAIYTVDPKNGNVISAKNTFNNTLIDEFRLAHFSNNDRDQNQLVLLTPENKHLQWNIVEGASCELDDGAADVLPSTKLELVSLNIPASIQDHFQTGSYIWTRSDAEPDAELICENMLPLTDQLPTDTIACQENGLVLDISEIPYDIIWEDGSQEKTRFVSESGRLNYRVDHCFINFSETIDVELEKCNCQFFLPNAISPNDDGLNDKFQVFNRCEYLTSFEIKIFNRWGGLVFSSQDQLFVWDGTYRGQKAMPAVYTYFLKYQSNFDQEPIILEGSIALLR